jgi:hypothetical protein
MDARQRCIGGNEYASVSQNHELILDMARQLTGRQNPLGDSSPAPQPQPEPNDPETRPGSSSFAITRELEEQSDGLTLQVKNTSGRSLRACTFTLSPVRSFWGFYRVEYDITANVQDVGADQTLDLTFQDPYADDSRLSGIQSYTLSKRCQE